MNGQGCPRPGAARDSARRSRWQRRVASAIAAAALCALLLLPGIIRAADWDIRLRIAWGGGAPRTWQGTIRLSSGTLSDPQPLGLEADAPGSMHLADPSTLRVFPRTPRSYDGVDLRVQAPPDAKLIVELSAGDAAPLDPIELPLARVVKGFQQLDLDEQHNRLLAQRSPGDALRVALPRDSLVFAPGDKVELEVQPGGPELTANTTYLLAVTLSPGRGDDEITSEDHEVKTDAEARTPSISLAVPLPQAEGVYDLKLALYPKRLTTSLVRGKPVVQRKVQVVAVAPIRPIDRSPPEWKTVYELDPANPRWWERMARLPSLRRIPSLAPDQLTSGPTKSRTHLGRPWIELPSAGWQAYPLTIESPGQPHILEVEYPSDEEQTLGISLIEPNAAGRVQPIGLDSGVEVPAPAAAHQSQLKRHRLVFWPRTGAPWVLLTNRRDDRPALLGKINVLAGPAELPAVKLPASGVPGRTLAAYFDKPLVPENFSAAEALDPATGHVFDDWLTFYQAGERMVAALQYAGYNAVVLNVVYEGSAIYPSRLLAPTPKYDRGVFFESGQDPVRKDALELILRLCDRAGIQVIPAVQFAAPLPELEAIRLAGGPEASGLEPVGRDGQTWLARNGPRRGMGAYYNALDPRVQQAMQDVVAELADRYGRHASFGGAAVQWTADSFAVLPDEMCSYDDATIARFEQDTQSSIPSVSGSPLADRNAYLHKEGAQAWLAWRAERMAALYGKMQADIARVRNNARLYLVPADLFGSRPIQQALRPTLPAADAAGEVLLMLGIDPVQLSSQKGIVLPRPYRSESGSPAWRQALANHWNQSDELDSLFASRGWAAAIQFHEPAPLWLPDFDKVSPFGPDKTHTWLVAQISPADAAARQRFVHSVAAVDAPLVIDGGWLLPLGQEDALLPAVKVFRRLPAEPFATAQTKGNATSQGVVVRTLARGGKLHFYVVNDTPWPAQVEIDFAAAEALRVTPYSDSRKAALTPVAGGGAVWSVNLEPFDLVGGELNSARATVADFRATFPSEVKTWLDEQILGLTLRANALRSPRPLAALANPSFEVESKDGSIPGWVFARGPGLTVAVDPTQGHESPRSLHLVSRAGMDGTPAPSVWVRSEPFEPPSTGRLTIVASLRIPDPNRQPKLRLAIEGKDDGRPLYLYGNVGLAEDGRPARLKLGQEWTRCRLLFPDLPLEGLTNPRIGFDLMGEGDVWIDDVQVFDLWFEESERDDLLKSIATTRVQLTNNQLPECQRFITGYWPSFLRQHVPLPDNRPGAAVIPGKPPLPPVSAPSAAAAPSSTWDRMRSWLPKTPSFWR